MSEIIDRLLRQVEEQQRDDDSWRSPLPSIQAKGQATRLEELYPSWKAKTKPIPGTLVMIDETYRRFKIPRPKQPVLVVEVFSEPVLNLMKDSSINFGAPYDIRVMFFDSDGDVATMLLWHKEVVPFIQH